jgi:hypothetical protein
VRVRSSELDGRGAHASRVVTAPAHNRSCRRPLARPAGERRGPGRSSAAARTALRRRTPTTLTPERGAVTCGTSPQECPPCPTSCNTSTCTEQNRHRSLPLARRDSARRLLAPDLGTDEGATRQRPTHRLGGSTTDAGSGQTHPGVSGPRGLPGRRSGSSRQPFEASVDVTDAAKVRRLAGRKGPTLGSNTGPPCGMRRHRLNNEPQTVTSRALTAFSLESIPPSPKHYVGAIRACTHDFFHGRL